MLRCKEPTHLLSESQDRSLSRSEHLQLKMHLAMCSGCRNFKGQMAFLRQACRRHFTDRNELGE